jgi:hypothetical protein
MFISVFMFVTPFGFSTLHLKAITVPSPKSDAKRRLWGQNGTACNVRVPARRNDSCIFQLCAFVPI